MPGISGSLNCDIAGTGESLWCFLPKIPGQLVLSFQQEGALVKSIEPGRFGRNSHMLGLTNLPQFPNIWN